MNRRSFLKRIGAVVVALTLARELPGIAAATPRIPAPDMTHDEVLERYIRPAARKLADEFDAQILRAYADAGISV